MPSLNVLAVALLVAQAGTIAGPLFGVHDRVYGIMFVSAWMLPIARLTLRPRPASSGACGDSIVSQHLRPWFVILGVLPWVMVPWAQAAVPKSVLWQSLDVPVPLRWTGIALTVAMFSAPFCRRIFRTTASAAGSENDFVSMRTHALSAATLVLVSANPFIAFVAASGMVCLYFARRGGSIRRTRTSEASSEVSVNSAGPEIRVTYDAAICSASRA